MQLPKTFAVALRASLYLIPLAGCEQEGPAEKAGKEMDRAVEDAGDAVEDAGKNLKEASE
jgi:hypothetical protein